MPGLNNWTSEIQVNLLFLILNKYSMCDFGKFFLNMCLLFASLLQLNLIFLENNYYSSSMVVIVYFLLQYIVKNNEMTCHYIFPYLDVYISKSNPIKQP